MSEREAFLRAIAANEGDHLVRLVYADWLDEHGEHEEADRQRRWPEAKAWLDGVLQDLNDRRPAYAQLPFDALLEFGREVSATDAVEVVYSVDEPSIPNLRAIAEVIRDRIPEFWQAWAVVTGLPLKAGVEQKSYIDGGWVCCSHETYPERYLAGPKPERFVRAEREEEELRREGERAQRLSWEEQFDAVRDELEKDRP